MLGRFMCRLFCILVLVLLSTLPSTRSTITTASTTIPQATFNSPVLPTSLPLPLKAPRLVTNRWVNTSVEYDVWPAKKRIPRLLWMAVVDETEDMPPHVHTLLARNANWLPQVCGNVCKDEFMKRYWGNTSVYWAYNQLGSIAGSFKADIWRYCVLYTFGGMYIDDDSDLKTLFDEVVLQKDTLILSEEGATTWGPCYISSFSLSEAAFYRNYTTLLHNPKYDPNKVFFQGFKDPTGDKPDLDLTEAERIAASRHSDFLVPMQLDRVTEPIFFHGNTLINWCIFAAPRHPLFARVLQNVVTLIRNQYLLKSDLHVAKWEPKHKMALCSTTFVMTYTLRGMLVDGSFSNNNNSLAVINDSEWVPRVSVRDFREYGGKCKAIWTGGNPNHYSKKFKTHPHLLKGYADESVLGVSTLRETIQSLNNMAAMKSEGRDRGIYYISNITYAGPPPVGDEAILDSFTKHPFGDMDSLNDYGYVAAEIKHVHHTVIERLKEGVTVLSKTAVRKKIQTP